MQDDENRHYGFVPVECKSGGVVHTTSVFLLSWFHKYSGAVKQTGGRGGNFHLASSILSSPQNEQVQ